MIGIPNAADVEWNRVISAYIVWIMMISTRRNRIALKNALKRITNFFMFLGKILYNVTIPSCPPRSKAIPEPINVSQTKKLIVISSVAAKEK
jgi:hypothetical protein